MQASSLVFVAIVVGWLVYLLPQWVRRRDALGAARGRDRHSAGLRVLSRRHRTAARRSTVPLLSPPDGATLVVDDADDHENGVVYVPGTRPGPRPVRAPDPSPEQAGPPAQSSPEGIVPSPSRVAARRRAAVLAVVLLATVGAWAAVLAGASALPAVVASTVLVLYVQALRSAARRRAALREAEAERARQDRARAAGRAGAGAAGSRRPARGPARVPAAAGRDDDTLVLEPVRVPVASGAAASAPDDGTWVPVPVPPPTYTLKPMAPRPGPALLEARRAQEAAARAAAEEAEREAAEAELAEAERVRAGHEAEREAREAERRGYPGRGSRVVAHAVDLDEVLERRRAVND